MAWLPTYGSGCTPLTQHTAASVNFLMHSEEAIFHQAVLLGGSFLMMRPVTEQTAESMYGSVTRTLGLANLSPEKRVEILLTLPQEELVAEITPELVSLGPAIDDNCVPAVATFANLLDNTYPDLAGKEWCRRLLVIESQFDVSSREH